MANANPISDTNDMFLTAALTNLCINISQPLPVSIVRGMYRCKALSLVSGIAEHSAGFVRLHRCAAKGLEGGPVEMFTGRFAVLRGAVAADDEAAESGEGGRDTADTGFDVGEEDDVTGVV
jgi:hypothetical protein